LSEARKPKKQKKRRRGSIRKYTLYYLLAFFLIAAVGVSLSLTVFFKTAQIEVAGNTVYSDEELIETAGVEIGDNLLRLRTESMARRLEEQYPYLETVQVRRTLPDTLTIRVTVAEERAVLRDAETGRFAVLSRAGRALRVGLPLCPEGMVSADGFAVAADGAPDQDGAAALEPLAEGARLTEGEKARFAALLEILDALEAQGLSADVNVIDLRDLLEIRFLYRGRLAVLLGAADDLEYKVRFAKAAIGQEVTDETVGTLDVSQKPTARLREYDIYTAAAWPFSPDLLNEYERKIVKDNSWQSAFPAEDDGTAPADAASSEAPAQAVQPQAPAQPAGESSAAEPASESEPEQAYEPAAEERPQDDEPVIIVEEDDGEEAEVIFVE